MSVNIKDIANPFSGAAEMTQLSKDKARALIEWMEEYSKKIGLAKAPELHHIAHDLPNLGGAFHEGKGYVVVTEGFLKHVCNSPDLNTHVPTNLKALIAHEMSHVSEISKALDGISRRKLPIFMLPALALIGYEIYTLATQRHKEDPSKKLADHIDDAAVEHKKKAQEHNPIWVKPWEQPLSDWGKRIAVVGAGFIAGSMVARHMSLASEFRADKAAVLACGDPKIVIDTLKKLHKVSEEIMRPQLDEWVKSLSKRNFMEKVDQIYQVICHDFQALTYHAHPGEAKRYKDILNIAAEHGLPLH